LRKADPSTLKVVVSLNKAADEVEDDPSDTDDEIEACLSDGFWEDFVEPPP
jgi:hypothetical protein